MIAVVGSDYFFIPAKDVFEKMAEANGNMNIEYGEEFDTARRGGKVVKCTLVKCPSSKLIFVHVARDAAGRASEGLGTTVLA